MFLPSISNYFIILSKTNRVKKIYYVPGLISAILLPILFWYYGNQRVHPQYTVMDLGIPPKITPETPLEYTFEAYRNWNYKKIRIFSGTAKENSKLYVSEIKNLQKRNEKETGVEFILDQNNTYGDFVSILNDMAIAKHDTYALDLEKTGHLFATVQYKDPNIKELSSECLLCNDVIYTLEEDYHPNNLFESMQQIYKGLPKDVYLFYFCISFIFKYFNVEYKRKFSIS